VIRKKASQMIASVLQSVIVMLGIIVDKIEQRVDAMKAPY
jgi:hypothetical protein